MVSFTFQGVRKLTNIKKIQATNQPQQQKTEKKPQGIIKLDKIIEKV